MNKEQRVALLQKYWEGKENKFARWWMYLRNANSSLNEFRSYGYILVGIYLGTPYFQEHWLIAGIILIGLVTVSVPLMILFGRWLLYRADPAQEFARAVKGSVMGEKGYEAVYATIETRDLLIEIRDNLKINQK